MSNKEILQEYNTKLVANNDSLQTVMNMINNLPEAGGDGMIKYSTEEQVIGTWNDGRPVYLQCFVGDKSGFEEGSTTWYKAIKENVNEIIAYGGSVFETSGSVWGLPLIDISSNSFSRVVVPDGAGTMYVYLDKNKSYDKYNIWVKFTKTTDEPATVSTE